MSDIKKRKASPSLAAIVAANDALVKALPNVENPERDCWRCGRTDIRLFKAHVMPDRYGGSVEPSNFFILCLDCHKLQPDGISRFGQEQWLLSAESYGECEAREWCEVVGRIIRLAESQKVPPAELSWYLKSQAFMIKSRRVLADRPPMTPKHYASLVSLFEGLMREFLPPEHSVPRRDS